jgi:hypothetical protein
MFIQPIKIGRVNDREKATGQRDDPAIYPIDFERLRVGHLQSENIGNEPC